MSSARLLAIGLIYLCTAVAWSTLGLSVVNRTGEFDARLSKEVAQLWGGRHNQVAPLTSVLRPRQVTETVQETDNLGRPVRRQVTKTVEDRIPVALGSSRIAVDLKLQHRQKGLLWYDTYTVDLSGKYRVQNPDDVPRTLTAEFRFPSADAIYDGFVFQLAGQDAPKGAMAQAVTVSAVLPPHGEADLVLAYRSRGLDDWTYAFAPEGVSNVQDFALDMTTDFRRIDFPPGTVSPTTKTPAGDGWRLGWQFASLVTGQKVGLDLPNKLNPGPVAARITFFAPVSLLFFLTVMVILGVLSGRSLHPMNYFFLAAAFFSFHLLLAYLVDHLQIHASFLIASAVSLFLVVTYLRRAAGLRSAVVREAALAQFLYLVLFSYAFFFEGYTGLTVTIGAVLTLFVLMQITARVDWGEVFSRPAVPPLPPRPHDAGPEAGIIEGGGIMRRLRAFEQVSLDGFFTDAGGDMSWAHKQDPEWNEFAASNAKGGGALLFGRVTYQMMERYWPTPAAREANAAVAEGMNKMPKVVFSRTLEKAAWSNTTLVKSDPAAAVRTMKSEPGPDMVILGSGTIVSQLAQAGLIDEYQIVVSPIVLGKGRTLFETVANRIGLKRIRTRPFSNGNVVLWYEPVA